MTSAEARAIVRALRVGTAPSGQAGVLGVGQEAMGEALAREMRRLRTSGETHPVLVEGPWGTGKSHSLALARAITRDLRVAASAVTFNARTAPLSHPNRIYPTLVANIESAGLVGLRSILLHVLRDPGLRARVAVCAQVLADPFGSAVRDLLLARDRGDELLLERGWAWSVILGADLTARDDPARKAAAIRRIGAVATLMRECGFGGLVVLADEVESLGQLWNATSRVAAYNALGSLLQLPGILWVLGAGDDFQRTVDSDLSRGVRTSWRLQPSGVGLLDEWCSGRFRRLSPPPFGMEQAARLAEVVDEVYSHAYGTVDQRKALASIVHAWANTPSRNPRRLARALVEALDGLRPLLCDGQVASIEAGMFTGPENLVQKQESAPPMASGPR